MTKRPNPIDRYARHLPPGRLEWIGLRPGRRQEIQVVSSALAVADRGLVGDHRTDKTPGSARQVTLISTEFIEQIAHFTSCKLIEPSLLRRNLVVSGINLNALRHQRFGIGDALFEARALCHPCSRMEEALGPGGVAAMLGHGGLCLSILRGGKLHLGDAVSVMAEGDTPDLFGTEAT